MMARIRTIKPEFWCDEKLSPLSAIDRLTFLGLISMADDYGRVHDNIKIIDAFVFPNTSDCVRESLANLSRINRIRRGNSSSGMPIIEIVNWDKHQRVDKPQPKLALPPIAGNPSKTLEKPRDNCIPESFANDSGTARELVAPLTTDLRPTTTDPDQRPKTNDHIAVRDSVSVKKAKVEKPESVEAQHWEDWQATRKAKKAGPLTATAWAAIEREAVKAGMTIAKTVQVCAENRWIGFKAEWVSATSRDGPVTFAQQRLKNTQSAIEEFVNNG